MNWQQFLQDRFGDHWIFWLVTWGVVVVVVGYFAIKHWAKIRQFLIDVREELKKCSWPTWQELRESTVVVAVSVMVLGIFVFYADVVFENSFGGILYACGLRSEWLWLH